MSAPPSMIIAALDVFERKVQPHNLVRSGAVARDSEAKHLLEMLREARLYMEEREAR